MKQSQLNQLLPKHRDDVEAVKELVSLGYPNVAPILANLFQWLETSCSAVELIIRPFFAALGEPALELVRAALQAKYKPARKATLLADILPVWPPELISKLEQELMALVRDSEDFYSLDAYALRLLIDKQVGDQNELERWRQFKIARLRTRLEVLEGGSVVTPFV